MNHLAIYSQQAYGDDYIAYMLAGLKTIDSKFSFRRTAPYKKLDEGDVIYLKESSGPIRGRVFVSHVVHEELTGPDHLMEFLAPYATQLGIKDEAHLMQVWQQHHDKRYVCQWHMINPQSISRPVRINKHDMRSWIVDWPVPPEVWYAF
jgi:hypothetical protein